MLSAFLFTLMNNVLCNFQAPWVDRLCEKNDTKGLYRLFWATWFFRFFVPVMVFFVGIAANVDGAHEDGLQRGAHNQARLDVAQQNTGHKPCHDGTVAHILRPQILPSDRKTPVSELLKGQ